MIGPNDKRKSLFTEVEAVEVPEDDFEAELRKLQELDEDKVALGHKGMTEDERFKSRLSRLKSKKSMFGALTTAKITPLENSPSGTIPNSENFSSKLGAAFRNKFGV